MSLESPKFEKGELIVPKEGAVFDDFDVSFFDGAKEIVGEDFEESLQKTKEMVDEILGSQWDMEEDKLNVYLFSDENQYREYLKKNFPKIPDNMATFDQKTNSVFRCGKIPESEEDKGFHRANMFSGIGHEMAHLHPFFGGVGNKASNGKRWEQEAICEFVEDKVRAGMGSDLRQKWEIEWVKKELEENKKEGRRFSIKKADTEWEKYSSLGRLFYPWLEKKYGMEKLRQLWTTLFKEKKGAGESLKEVYGEDIDNLEEQFMEHVEKAQNYEEFEIKSEAEKAKDETFQRYLVGLNLNAENLKDKRILDLGCGEEGEFVKKLVDDGITKEIYGLDSAVKPEEIDENYRENILQGDFETEFPVKNLDYVVSVGAIDPSIEEGDTRNPQKTILSALESLKDSGEIRIFPIRSAEPDSGLEGIVELRKKWLEILDNLSSQDLIDYELKPIQTRESENRADKWIEEVLIIKKKEKKK